MSEATKPGATQAALDLNAEITKALAADRARMAAIKGCDEAKGREALAEHLALSGMSFEQSKAILAVSPKAEATPTGNAFKAAMDNSQHPNVGSDAAAADGDDKPSKVARLLQSARQAGVLGYEPAKKSA